MLPLLRAWRRRSRERVRTRSDRYDRAVVVDGVDAILQMLLARTAWIARKHILVPGACQTVDGRQEGRSVSGGIPCKNLVAVLVTPEAQGQSTTRLRAVVAERDCLSSARCRKHDRGCSVHDQRGRHRVRRMEPVALIRVCLRN